jgi:CMP-N-acetylneuraminic acid synthetase
MKKEIVGLVPVKGQSERVIEKNTRNFHNTTLLELKLDQLSNTQGFENIIVSSEDSSILQIANKKGFDTHHRDPKYSTSKVPMSDVYSYIASEITGENIAWINVTNPLVETEIYDNAIEIYNELDTGYDCLLSAIELRENFFYQGKAINFDRSPWPRSQDLSPVLSLSFSINILKRDDMVRWGSCVGTSPYFYCLDKIDSWDIDNQEDFDFCEMIYQQRNP